MRSIIDRCSGDAVGTLAYDAAAMSNPHTAGGTATLSESASKQLVREFGIPTSEEQRTPDSNGAVEAARAIGFPVVLKLNGDAIAHKTERDLVRLALTDEAAVRTAADELLASAQPGDGEVDLLVAEMVRGSRELICGLVRDPQFGPCVALGLGGILTEALGDVVFAAAPLERAAARALIGRLNASHLLTRPFRGEPAVDADALVDLLVGLGRLGCERPDVVSVDLNPVILAGARPVAVDALVELGDAGAAAARDLSRPASDAEILERFRPLFHPKGIVVAGVAGHPGKFGFVTYHNLRRFGYPGAIYPVKPDGADVLGEPTLTDIEQLPDGAADLLFICTPSRANMALLEAAAAKGVRAAFVASGGYAEAGDEGRALQRELAARAEQLDVLLIGPNGQGVISTPESMCAQITAPFPPRGRIGVASQSGNLVSAFLNYSVQTGVGVSKAVSLGNSAQTGLAEILEYFAVDPDTDTALVYVEGVGDGERFRRAVERLTARKPLVLVKGGVADAGKRAAASHTGALASDDAVFDGLCRQLGVLRAPTIEEAFEWAATLATQPLPKGNRTVVFTSVGGWGVLAADACAEHGLDLIALPADIEAAIDELVPPRWSRNNPIDLAGGETRETIPAVLDLLAGHPEVDAVIHLGLGIQANQANAFRTGRFFEPYGLERIAQFHESQDARYATAAIEASERHGVPILSCSELVTADRYYGNAGPSAVREAGRLCYPSAHRAVRALRAALEYAAFRG